MRLLIVFFGFFSASVPVATLARHLPKTEAHSGKEIETDTLVLKEIMEISDDDARAIVELLGEPKWDILEMAKKDLGNSLQAEAAASYLSADKWSKTVIATFVSGKPALRLEDDDDESVENVLRSGFSKLNPFGNVGCERKSQLAEMMPEVEGFKRPVVFSRYVVDFVLEPTMKVRRLSGKDLERTCPENCKNSAENAVVAVASTPRTTRRHPMVTRLPSTTKLPSKATTKSTTRTTTKPTPKKCGYEISSDESDESNEFKVIQNLTPSLPGIWNKKSTPTPSPTHKKNYDSSEETSEEEKPKKGNPKRNSDRPKEVVAERV